MQAELYWIDGPWPGRLAIMPRPRGGDWLEEETVSWRRMCINIVVSTLTKEEIAELDLAQESDVCAAGKIALISFPIVDRDVPTTRKSALELVLRLEQELALGKNIAIHCRQGVGRSSLLAACVLCAGGVDLASAWQRIAAARRCSVPDTKEQREWIDHFSRETFLPLAGRTSNKEKAQAVLRGLLTST